MNHFHANGKLLLTAEYFVLDGALALALPVRLGQSLDLRFTNKDSRMLHWRSLNEKGECWFEVKFDAENFNTSETTDPTIAERLQKIMREARGMNPFFPITNHQSPITRLEFPRLWGLGTSSTLIYLVAKWAGVDPFELSANTFGGSGYDIACAGATGPILYRLQEGKPQVHDCDFYPPFHNSLYFIYLGQKQDSRDGIKNYRSRMADNGLKAGAKTKASEISDLTLGFLAAQNLLEFDELIRKHESLVSVTLGLPRAKSLFFDDFWGEVKSLGAWGGDFVLATSDRPAEETRQFFNERGFGVFLPFNELILQRT